MPFDIGYFVNIEGVIHGSRTSHPPKLTPLIFSLPQLYPDGLDARLLLNSISTNTRNDR